MGPTERAKLIGFQIPCRQADATGLIDTESGYTIRTATRTPEIWRRRSMAECNQNALMQITLDGKSARKEEERKQGDCSQLARS
jgi:hypothetical protein